MKGGETVKERNLTLAALRVNKRMQQKKVAEILGVTPATLASWESGKTVPNILQAQRLANMYGANLDDILFALTDKLKD
jgi:DNA-binding XRE family transcriptional regulator